MFWNFTEDQLYTIPSVIIGIIVLLIFLNLIKKKRKRLHEKSEINQSNYSGYDSTSSPLIDAAVPQSLSGKKPSSQESDTPWFQRLRHGLEKTRAQLVQSLDDYFSNTTHLATRDQLLEHLFELLILADVGVSTSEILVQRVKARLTSEDYSNKEKFKAILKDEILLILKTSFENKNGTIETPKYSPHIVLMVGVNGAGKTTTTGKLAFKAYQKEKSVIIGAADTFRAAAVEQLAVWSDRSHAQMIRLKEGSDPASVAYEAARRAQEQHADICLIDTAGRLQTRQDLMQELSKIARVTGKDIEAAPHEVLLVLDATVGQNAVQQAKLFRDVVKVTGIILTKLDGTAKGGVAIPIAFELGLPIRYVGVGESVEDLELFSPEEFVDALFI